MASKPIALELADALEKNGEGCTCCAYASFECCCEAVWGSDYTREAAAELRRLHEDNVFLKKALWAAASKIEKLAFQLAAPNAQTPEFMSLAVSIRKIVSQEQPR